MKRTAIEFFVGLFVLIGIASIGYLSLRLGQMKLSGDSSYELTAKFISVTGLAEGARIEMAGVQVGQVKSIVLDQKENRAVVILMVNEGVELDEEVTASVKTSGLIGDKYIRLKLGAGDELLEGGDIIEETESTIDIEELISKYVFGGV